MQAGAEQLQTTNATIGNVVEQKAIEQLPLNGRNPLTLIALEPGVMQRSNGAAGTGVHVNGSRDFAFNVTIDGIEANESSVPNPVNSVYRINPDNIREFKVTTNNATAEEGRNSGASISVSTRSGTNDFHGSVFYFHRNDALNSNEFLANALSLPKPVIKMHQYGFEESGPVRKNKTFFFGSYQGNKITFTQPIDQTFGIPDIYTGPARQGIFRYFVPNPASPLVIDGTTITRNNRLLVDPTTGALRAGVSTCATPTSVGCVRTYNIFGAGNNLSNRAADAALAPVFGTYPLPNNFGVAGDGLNTAAFLWNPPTKVEGPAISARVDHNFNSNNSVFARFLYSDYDTLEGDPNNSRPQVFPGLPPLGEVFRRSHNLALSWRRVISPRVVNEFTAGYARFGFLFTQGEANPDFPDIPPFDFSTIDEPFNNRARTARNAYVQDEWRVRPNLTLNYGVRWELNPPATTVGGEVLRPVSPIQAGPTSFAQADTWYDTTDIGVFGPRLGVAWSPDWKSGLVRTLFGPAGRSVLRGGYGIAYDTVSSFQVTAAAGRVPGLLATCSSTFPFATVAGGCPAPANTSISGGFPLELQPPTVTPSSLLTPAIQRLNDAPPITVFAPEMKVPTVHQWSLSYQRELPGGFVMQTAYVGRAGNRLFMAYNINQINSDSILPSFLLMRQNVRNGCLPAGTGAIAGQTCTNPVPASQIPLLAANVTGVTNTFVNAAAVQTELSNSAAGAFAARLENTPGAFQVLKLRPNQQFGTITYIDNSGASNYHSAQLTLRRRFTSGFGLNLAYTFGKSIDNQSVDPVASSSGGGLSTMNSRTPTDIRDFRIDRGCSDFDRTHTFSLASTWDIPVGRGKHFLGNAPGFVNQILGGWTINGVFNAMSGEPFSVRSGERSSNSAHESRADVIAPVEARLLNVPSIQGPVLFENDDAFRLPAPGTNGAGRNIFVAPGYWNLDLSFIKRFQITERLRLQFRTEMFNALNHANFDNPRDASVGSPSISSTLFGQTCCAAVAPPRPGRSSRPARPGASSSSPSRRSSEG